MLRRMLSLVVLATLVAGCSGQPSSDSSDADEHRLHSQEEHYDRSGPIPER